MTNREYIPSYGPDKKALRAGMMWLLDSENQELFLYLSLKSHLDQGRIIHTMYGENFCKTLQKNEKTNVDEKIIVFFMTPSFPKSGNLFIKVVFDLKIF